MNATEPKPRVKLRKLGSIELPGGGQVVVDGDTAYVGHIDPPHGTSILDVSDPRNPRILARLEVPHHTHSHKVRAAGGIMLVNNEVHPFGAPPHPDFQGGLRVFDVTRPSAPREIAFFRSAGTGVHRFDFDGRYAYISPDMDGFIGNITLILDLTNPSAPREVSRWWLPGQWIAGGERPDWEGRAYRTHHPLRFGDRLYVSCWQAGYAIVDIADITNPRTIARSPSPFEFPTHTIVPLDDRFVAVVDEGWNDAGDAVPAFLWVSDTTSAGGPAVVSRYDIPPPTPKAPGFWGAHQPHERIVDGLAFVAWFGRGLRVIDLTDRYHPAEVAAFMPERDGRVPMSNDVFVDGRNRVYLADRLGGLDILEWSR